MSKETAEPVIVLGSTGVALGKKDVPGNIHNFDEMGNEYICGFVEKICTHNPEFIIKPENDDSLFDYYMVPVDFEVFKNEAAAGLSGQTERLVRQVYKVFSNPRPCYIPKADGSGYKAMPPFIIALETADKRSLSVADIQRLERLQNNTTLSDIMHWIKNISAKRWNFIHGSKDHLWGHRYFARVIKDPQEYESTMNYIDQNAVAVGLAASPEEWKASGAFYKSRGISGLMDYSTNTSQPDTKLLPSIPCVVSNLIPPAQLEHILRYIGVYAAALDILFDLISGIPKIGKGTMEPFSYLHYFTGTHDYYISEYDGEDTMFGRVCSSVYPAVFQWQKFSLSGLKKNQLLKLEMSYSTFQK